MSDDAQRIVLTYGTFDIFHVGHVRLLRRARTLGDTLIVACSTDEFNATKGKSAVFTFEERKEILESCRFVDLVIPERRWDQKAEDIREYGVSVFTMGDDWEGQFDELAALAEVVYLKRTSDISTTEVRKKVRSDGKYA